MAYKITLTKIVSVITLAVFLFTNIIYASPPNLNSNKLRAPLISNHLSSAADGIQVAIGNASYSHLYEDVKREQIRIQGEVIKRLPGLHSAVGDDAKGKVVRFMGSIEEPEIAGLEKIIDDWAGKYKHVVFVTEKSTALAKTLLQIFTNTSDWNEELEEKGRPQVHFVDPYDQVAVQRLLAQGDMKPSDGDSILLVNPGVADDKRSDDRAEAIPLSRVLQTHNLKYLPDLTEDTLGLLAAGLIEKGLVRRIYNGAKAEYEDNMRLSGTEEIEAYSPYQFAATQVRFAMTGQNMSVFEVVGSYRYRGLGIWLAEQFNRQVGNAGLSVMYDGENLTQRHATGQGKAASREYPWTNEIDNEANRGFIALTFISPTEEDPAAAEVLVHGEASDRYKGYKMAHMSRIESEAERLSYSSVDRPIIDLGFRANPENIGRFIHFGQIAAEMAGRLAGAKPEQKEQTALDKKIQEKIESGKTGGTKEVPDGVVQVRQNILTFEQDASGNYSLGGLVGDFIREDHERGGRVFEYLVRQMGTLSGGNTGLKKVVTDIHGGKKLIHLDPKKTQEDIDISEAWAERFKKYRKIYICATGGSITGDSLVRELNMTDGPELIFLPDYDPALISKIEEEIRQNPSEVAVVEISKSGVTPVADINASALFKALSNALGDGKVKEHYLAITDRQTGDLSEKVKREGFLSIDHPEHGGRFTMFTPLGLFFYFLKGGDKKALEDALKQWESNNKRLSALAKRIGEFKEKLDLGKSIDDSERIKAMKDIFDALSSEPGVWLGFLRTFLNTVKEFAPELYFDRELAMTMSGNKKEMISPDKPLGQQIMVESLAKAGVRFYAMLLSELNVIRSLWNRVISDRRLLVTMHSEAITDSPEGQKTQAIEDAMFEELTRHRVPLMLTRTGRVTIGSMAAEMRKIYLELAVAAAMYSPMEVESEGERGVRKAKAIIDAFLDLMSRIQRTEAERICNDRGWLATEENIASIVMELRKGTSSVPKLSLSEVKSIRDRRMDLRVSMGMDAELTHLIEKFVNNDEAGNPGLVTLKVRSAVSRLEPHKIQAYLRERIMKLLESEHNIGKIIMDGEAIEINKGGAWVVRITSLESQFSLLTGTANGASLDIFERTDDGLRQDPVACVRIKWGSTFDRVIVSRGARTLDFMMLDNGSLVEVAKPGENNLMRSPVEGGSYIAVGGASKEAPPCMQDYESEVLFTSRKFKIREAGAPTPDMYMAMVMMGSMRGWMTWGEAIGLRQIAGAASNLVMMITEKGMTDIMDIEVTEELLESQEQVYVIAGPERQVNEIRTWIDFINVGERERREKAEPVDNAVVFKIMEFLKDIAPNADINLRSWAIMLLLRLEYGLDTFPADQLLEGETGDIIARLRSMVKQELGRLNKKGVMQELGARYIGLSFQERRDNRMKFVLLGHKDSLMRPKIKPGDETIEIRSLEQMHERIPTSVIMENISGYLASNDKVKAALEEITKAMADTHRENAIRLPGKAPIELPKFEFGETAQDYVGRQVAPNIKLPEDMPNLLKEKIRGLVQEVPRLIQETFLHDTVLEKEGGDEAQTELIRGLKSKFNEVFFVDEAGVEKIHRLEWILNNIREEAGDQEVNISGDITSKLDFIFNVILNYRLRQKIAAIVSEEDKEIVYGLEIRSQVSMFSDPIDGSSGTVVGAAFGSIFTQVYLKMGQSLEDGTFDPRKQCLLGFELQYGWPHQLLTIYNPRNEHNKPEVVQFALTGEGENRAWRKEFTYPNLLDMELDNLKWDGGLMPVKGDDPGQVIELALGGSFLESRIEDGHREFILLGLIEEYGYENSYTGALLNDMRRNLLINLILFINHMPQRMGVLYTYPNTGGKNRLRLPFEGDFYALLLKALGGEVIDGVEPLLNLKISGNRPSQIKIPLYGGSAWITKRIMAWADYIKKNNIEKSRMAMVEAWKKFRVEYKSNAQRLVKEIIAYSNEIGQPKTERDVRKALLSWDWDSRRMGPEDYFPRFLDPDMTGERAYKKLFPASAEPAAKTEVLPSNLAATAVSL